MKYFILSVLMVLVICSASGQVNSLTLNPTGDTYVFSSCSGCTNGGDVVLTTGNISGPGQFYDLIKFDMSQIPAHAVITSAVLTLKRSSGATSFSNDAMTIKYLTTAWNELTCNYQIYQGLGKSSLRAISLKSSAYDGNELNVNMRELTQHWVKGDIVNHGFVINYSGSLISFHSSNATNVHLRPVLKIEYFIPDVSKYVDANVFLDWNGGKNSNPSSLTTVNYSGYYQSLFYLDFDFSTIDNSKVMLAYLELSGNAHSSIGYSDFEVYPVTSPWSLPYITWSNQPLVSLHERIELPKQLHANQDYLVDISEIIENYRAEGFTGLHGFKIGKIIGNYDQGSFYSKSDANQRGPKIHILYLPIPYTPPVDIKRTTKAEPSEDMNYILKTTPLVPMEDFSEFDNTSQLNETLIYYDGLGRPIEEIQVAWTPLGNDLIKPITYDQFGRVESDFLPFPDGYDKGAFRDFDPAGDDVLNRLDEYYLNNYSESNPFSKTKFESSPLNRVLAQGSPGLDWQPNSQDSYIGNTNRFEYSGNESGDNIIIWEVGSQDEIIANGYYAPGQLYKNIFYDENGNIRIEYKDLNGKTILKESIVGVDSYRTYYVYDDFDLLRAVLPPLLSQGLTGSSGFYYLLDDEEELFYKLGYYYKYDMRNRMVLKKLPGVEKIEMIYDIRDRLIFSQDGELRDIGQWQNIKYDKLNRPVITALYDFTGTKDQLTSEMASYYNNTGSINDERDNSSIGYNVQSFPNYGYECLSITYYDNYNFPTLMGDGFSYGFYGLENISNYIDNDGTLNGYFDRVTGLVTGTATKVIGTNDYIKSVNYYDDKYQVIQSIQSTYPVEEDNYNRSSMLYTFTGQVEKTLQKQTVEGQSNKLLYEYNYDHSVRLLETYLKLNENDPVLTSQLNYNELGEMIEKNLFSKDQSYFTQSIDYKYNIRGWLTGINDPDEIEEENDMFGMRLHYNTSPAGLVNQPNYNGNISSIEWMNGTSKLCYNYYYDDLNRLTSADSHVKAIENWYGAGIDVPLISYDLNGNITRLKRQSIDDLYYDYIGNQLKKVDDFSSTYPERGFFDGDNLPVEYEYDLNGNMEKDYNKGIDISYNYLNLPDVIGSGSDNIQYTYDANGMKLAKSYHSGVTTKNTLYNGNFIYKDGVLEYILFDEGLISMTSATPEYNFFIKDHLGNTRVVFDDNGLVQQTHQYYPFGMEISGSQGGDVKYRYNGKELQDEKLGEKGLDWYDYGARMYDAALGRWHCVDPLAETYLALSPYHYGDNNPVKNIDIGGMGFVGAYGSWNECGAGGTIVFDSEGTANSARESSGLLNAVVQIGNSLVNPDDPPKEESLTKDPPKKESLPSMKDSPPNHPDYKSPKGGDRKVKNPNGKGSGWIDNKGRVWVPTDHKGTHAPHWDREIPGGGHENVYPFVNPTPWYVPSPETIRNTIMYGTIAVGVGIIILDIVTIPSGEGLIGVQMIRIATGN